jgi:hypothetical protein
MAAPAFRALANTTYPSAATSVTCAKPTGTVDGDIMVAFLVQVRAGSATSAPTPPSGWAQIATYQTVFDAANTLYARASVWWKRASSEGANYTWTFTETNNNQAVIASYSGCIASGNPVDVSSGNSASSGNTATATGVTTTVADTRLIYTGNNWEALGNLTPPTGMTERYDNLTYWSDQAIASAGATGNRTQVVTGSTTPWTAFLIALKPVVAAGKPVKVWSGSVWVTKPVKVWSGSAWVTKVTKVWNGSAWV